MTFRPELSHRNPIYREGLYAFNTFLARLNVMLRNDARYVTDIAVLYPIETMQGEHRFDGPLTAYEGGVAIPEMDYVQIGLRLTERLGRDFMFLHPEVLAQSCRAGGKTLLTLENDRQYNTFTTLIVPSSKTISAANLEKILAFFEAGGRVVFTTRMPEKSTEPGQDARIAELTEKLLPRTLRESGRPNENKQGGRVVFLPDPTTEAIGRALDSQPGTFDVEWNSGSRPLRYIHKRLDGKNIYYLANLDDSTFDSEIRLKGKMRLALWDPHTGEIAPVEARHLRQKTGTVTSVPLRLESSRSVFLVETK